MSLVIVDVRPCACYIIITNFLRGAVNLISANYISNRRTNMHRLLLHTLSKNKSIRSQRNIEIYILCHLNIFVNMH